MLKPDDLPQEFRSAFVGAPVVVTLPAGFRLYKLTDYPLIDPRTARITPWWSPVDPYENDPGLEQRLNLAARLRVSSDELTRLFSAVKENWNGMSHVLQSTLTESCDAFWGQCASQSRRDSTRYVRASREINLPGYGWQFFIPHLTRRKIKQVSFSPSPGAPDPPKESRRAWGHAVPATGAAAGVAASDAGWA